MSLRAPNPNGGSLTLVGRPEPRRIVPLVVGFVSGGEVRAEFFRSFVVLMAYRPRLFSIDGIIDSSGLYIASNRNVVTKDFLATPGEWLLWLDTDIAFAPETVDLLLGSALEHDADIMGARYHSTMKGRDSHPVAYRWATRGDTFAPIDDPGAEVVEVDVVGMGFTLVRRRVFEAVKDQGHWFTHYGNLGEDAAFCLRAQDAGFKILWNGALKVTHYKVVAL